MASVAIHEIQRGDCIESVDLNMVILGKSDTEHYYRAVVIQQDEEDDNDPIEIRERVFLHPSYNCTGDMGLTSDNHWQVIETIRPVDQPFIDCCLNDHEHIKSIPGELLFSDATLVYVACKCQSYETLCYLLDIGIPISECLTTGSIEWMNEQCKKIIQEKLDNSRVFDGLEMSNEMGN